MKIVYLTNGQKCYLQEKIGEKYVVNKIFEYDNGEYTEEVVDENAVVVDTVFDNPPIESIDGEIKALEGKRVEMLNELNELRAKKAALSIDIQMLTKTQIDSGNFVINKTDLINAKSLALFPKSRVMPILMENDGRDKSFRGLKISMEIKISEKGERAWGYKMKYDRSDYGGEFLCEKYGILIDPTPEQIDEVILKRLAEFRFEDYALIDVDSKYLNQDQFKRKDEYNKKRNYETRARLEKDIERAKQQLDKLEKVLQESN